MTKEDINIGMEVEWKRWCPHGVGIVKDLKINSNFTSGIYAVVSMKSGKCVNVPIELLSKRIRSKIQI